MCAVTFERHGLEGFGGTLDQFLIIGLDANGRVIRLIFPQLTEENRKQLGKDIKRMAEDSKVSIRNTRRDTAEKLKKLEKASEITEDDLRDDEKELQDLTDKYCKQIDQAAAEKTKEIMEI